MFGVQPVEFAGHDHLGARACAVDEVDAHLGFGIEQPARDRQAGRDAAAGAEQRDPVGCLPIDNVEVAGWRLCRKGMTGAQMVEQVVGNAAVGNALDGDRQLFRGASASTTSE